MHGFGCLSYLNDCITLPNIIGTFVGETTDPQVAKT